MGQNDETPRNTHYIDLVREELLGLDPRALLPVNLEPVGAAMTVLGVVEQLPVYRPALVELFGEARVAPLDRLELLANVLLQAHGRYRGLDSTIQLGPLVKDATKYRDVLLGEVRQLITREVLDEGTLGELTGVHGHKNVYVDLTQLIAVFRENASTLEEWCVVRSDYLDRAESAAARLAKAIGMKEQAGQTPAADLRNRAFTLLVQTYDEARRLVTCLRWYEADHDRIAPSLYAGRTGGRRRRSAGEEEADALPLPPPAAPVPQGLPGASPFATPDDRR